MKKKHQKISKSDKRIYRIFFGCVTAIVLILAFHYNSFFLMLHRRKDLYFAEPNLSSVVTFCSCVFVSIIFILNMYEKTYGSNVSIDSLLKSKKIFSLSCFIKILILSIVFCTMLFVNMNYYSYYNQDGFFQNDNLIFSDRDIESINVGAEKTLIAAGANKGMFYKYILQLEICTDVTTIYTDSDQFYGYEKIYQFLKSHKDIVSVDSNNFSKLIAFENNKLSNKREIDYKVDYIKRIMEEFA